MINKFKLFRRSINRYTLNLILDIKVAVDDAVKVGQRLMVLEAMKMENNVDSDKEGTVAEIRVGTGDSVLEGDVLIVIE